MNSNSCSAIFADNWIDNLEVFLRDSLLNSTTWATVINRLAADQVIYILINPFHEPPLGYYYCDQTKNEGEKCEFGSICRQPMGIMSTLKWPYMPGLNLWKSLCADIPAGYLTTIPFEKDLEPAVKEFLKYENKFIGSEHMKWGVYVAPLFVGRLPVCVATFRYKEKESVKSFSLNTLINILQDLQKAFSYEISETDLINNVYVPSVLAVLEKHSVDSYEEIFKKWDDYYTWSCWYNCIPGATLDDMRFHEKRHSNLCTLAKKVSIEKNIIWQACWTWFYTESFFDDDIGRHDNATETHIELSEKIIKKVKIMKHNLQNIAEAVKSKQFLETTYQRLCKVQELDQGAFLKLKSMFCKSGNDEENYKRFSALTLYSLLECFLREKLGWSMPDNAEIEKDEAINRMFQKKARAENCWEFCMNLADMLLFLEETELLKRITISPPPGIRGLGSMSIQLHSDYDNATGAGSGNVNKLYKKLSGGSKLPSGNQFAFKFSRDNMNRSVVLTAQERSNGLP